MLQFAHTRQSLLLLESVGRCVQQQEPILLVGETGVGKTALVSYLASITGKWTYSNVVSFCMGYSYMCTLKSYVCVWRVKEWNLSQNYYCKVAA